LEKDFLDARKGAWEMAEKISGERQRAGKKLKREMEKEVKTLGMPETSF
jgi:DNA repair ATPase RecN